MQIHAGMLVMTDLLQRYGERADRHRVRILSALDHLERGMHWDGTSGK